MRCQNCGDTEATIKINQLDRNGKIRYIYLCKICASQLQISNYDKTVDAVNEFAMDFLAMLQRKQNEYNINELTCNHCGLSFTDFFKKNRVGCEYCYKVFKKELAPMIKRVQNSYQCHIGKVPKICEQESKREEELNLLRKKLQEAIQIEAFENAAKLRDKIRELEGKDRFSNGGTSNF